MNNTGKRNTTTTGEAGAAKEIFRIRSYHDGDEHAINAMFNEVFSQNRDMSHWYWKYRDNPHGSYAISIAAGRDGTLVAHFAAFPLKLLYYGARGHEPAEFTIYHAGDKMTRRRFRQVGFGKSSLLAKTFMHFKDTYGPDALFTYGFMAHHSLRFGLLILNYTMIEPVPFRTLAWKTAPGSKTISVRKFIKGIAVEAVSDIDETWTELFFRTAPHYGALVRRDAQYLKWRYLQRPDRTYFIVAVRRRSRLAGWSVFYREGDIIIWGDALFEKGDLDCARSALSYVMSHPFSRGAGVIACWFPSRPAWWDSVLKRLGFITGPEPQGLHFCIGIYTDKNAPEMVKEHFYYTMGDSDLF